MSRADNAGLSLQQSDNNGSNCNNDRSGIRRDGLIAMFYKLVNDEIGRDNQSAHKIVGNVIYIYIVGVQLCTS